MASLAAPSSRCQPSVYFRRHPGGKRGSWGASVCSQPGHRPAATFSPWSPSPAPPVTGPWGSRHRRTEIQLFLCQGTPNWAQLTRVPKTSLEDSVRMKFCRNLFALLLPLYLNMHAARYLLTLMHCPDLTPPLPAIEQWPI